jgi:lipopolysaccharide transport system permease protein
LDEVTRQAFTITQILLKGKRRLTAISPRREHTQIPVIDIQPSRGWLSLNLSELWHYRELLFILIWRDIKVRYKQTVLGAIWAVIQPLLTMIVFNVFLGKLVPTSDIPYPIFTFTALLPWQLFSHALTDSGNSLISNQSLITKVYFPRLIIPLAAVLSGLVDFTIAFMVLLVMMMIYGIVPTIALLTLPMLILLALATALAVGLWLSALNVEYRDVRYAIPFLAQLWFYASPIVYPADLLSLKWRILYALNPMVGVIEGFRWALLGSTNFAVAIMLISTGIVVILLISGLIYFKRMEDTFADVV